MSGGIYRLRVKHRGQLPPPLLLALFNMQVVRRQMRNKQFTRDVIDTLGHRLRGVVLPIPSSVQDRQLIADAMGGFLQKRAALRRMAVDLGDAVELPSRPLSSRADPHWRSFLAARTRAG
jgi:hypothetical protein